MERTLRIQAPLPHIKSVNIWLLRGDPLTLIDTGPRTDEALVALEAGLEREGIPTRVICPWIGQIYVRQTDRIPVGRVGAV